MKYSHVEIMVRDIYNSRFKVCVPVEAIALHEARTRAGSHADPGSSMKRAMESVTNEYEANPASIISWAQDKMTFSTDCAAHAYVRSHARAHVPFHEVHTIRGGSLTDYDWVMGEMTVVEAEEGAA